MTLDELFNEYKSKKAEAEELLNVIAEEARHFCMAAVYWNRRPSFSRKIPQDEALSIFNVTFMKCVKRGLEGKTETLSGCLCFYFPRGMLDYMRQQRKIPVPLTEMTNGPDMNAEGLIDVLEARNESHEWTGPDSGILAREIMNRYLDLLESIPRFQRDALILNFSGFSHEDIAYFLDAGKKKVSKEKFNAREKLRKILHQRE